MRHWFIWCVLAAVVMTSLAWSQGRLEFEVASIKPNVSGVRSQSQRTEGKLFRATNVPARTLIRQAYGLMFEDYRLTGAPDWTSTERFDVLATMPGESTSKQMPEMLRVLLAERFRFSAHTEIREAPAYALVLARKDGRLGLHLRHAPRDCGAPGNGNPVEANQQDLPPCELQIGGEIRGRGQRIDALVKTLLQFAGRPITEKTGLTGGFDFDIQASELAGDDNLPSIFTAIQEQLGLKLESIRAPVEFVVVDSISRPEPN